MTRPDTNDNTMKHHSQSSELTGSLAASESLTHYPDHGKEFYEKELKRYNAGTREWPIEREKPEKDFMYNWILEKSGKK